ncbi:MAG: metallophosphoesterase [Bacillota bacterium]|nr:metallophosphoesterase [Bacillota bacterium]
MKKKYVMIIIASIIALCAILMSVSAVVCSQSLKVTDYSISAEGLNSELKIVCISDLHSKEYGNANEKLLSLIAEQKPDAIFANGDMINRDATEAEIQQFLDLLTALIKTAPVFYSTGNHEVDYMAEHGDALLDRIAETGATVLYDNYVETEIAGNTIRIGGTSGHYRDLNWEEQLDYAMQEEIGNTDIPAVVMMHMPENVVMDCARENWNADLYISGHTHGGVMRLPLVGGIVAPTQGLFPKYDYGQYLIDGRLNLIISSGLAGYNWIPRVFNKPEICVISLSPT